MGHYKSNVRDQVFNLFEVFDLDKTLGAGPFSDLDADTATEMLNEMARLCEGPIAESFVDGDRHPPVFDPATHTVTLPESFKESVRAFVDGGWDKVGVVEELGGVPVPKALLWALHEHVLGANPAVWMYAGGAGFAQIFYHLGTEEQKKWAEFAAERGWGATMVLTEPDAGSDVGAGRTKAVKQEDGTWHLDGVKRFITSADSDDLFENIMHLVLARPEGAGPGTKGLSLFMVPKFLFDPETGEPGERNGAFVTNVEHKMGLKVSATCELTFGQHGVPANGWLVGEVHEGIAQMFDVIEQARMMVGTKAIATLSTGYLNALEYAKERVQGADLTQMTDKTAPRVSITHHPDVRRSLMTQKAYAEGMRALYLFTATYQDDTVAKTLHDVDAGTGGQGQRPAAADRQGGRFGAGLRQAHREPADLRRVGLPAGLPGRAVHPRREDRLAVRGHHGHPGAGLLLPQDHPRQGSGAGPRGGSDRGVREERVRQRPAQDRAGSAGHRHSRTSRAWPRR